jgi:serine/threonine protein kinase
MGLVYEADHLGIGKRVAVKVLLEKYHEDDEVIARFEREARTASAIGDQHIVEVFDAGITDDGRSYLVMELLVGMSLADVAEATGPMAAARRCRSCGRSCAACRRPTPRASSTAT